jgi:hypothetical protein
VVNLAHIRSMLTNCDPTTSDDGRSVALDSVIWRYPAKVHQMSERFFV